MRVLWWRVFWCLSEAQRHPGVGAEAAAERRGQWRVTLADGQVKTVDAMLPVVGSQAATRSLLEAAQMFIPFDSPCFLLLSSPSRTQLTTLLSVTAASLR